MRDDYQVWSTVFFKPEKQKAANKKINRPLPPTVTTPQ